MTRFRLFNKITTVVGLPKKLFFVGLSLCTFLALSINGCFAQKNPFITQMYTADPSAHIWNDGRLYVYPSNDIDPPRGCDLMDQYHVFSTDDMIHWTDHGEILRTSQVPWGRPEGGFMWAPDCAFKNGTYYFYFGGGAICKGGKLKDNMMEIDGSMQDMVGLVDFHEATWVFKRNGVYY